MRRPVRKQIYIDAAQARLLKRTAKRRGSTESAIIREAISEMLESEERCHAWGRIESFLQNLMRDTPTADIDDRGRTNCPVLD